MSKNKMFGKKKGEPKVSPAEDGRVVMDCRGCEGPCELSDRECLVCTCKSIKDFCDMESLVMRSVTDKAYNGQSLGLLRELSLAYANMCMKTIQRKGKMCLFCKRSFSKIVADQKDQFPNVDTMLLLQRSNDIGVADPVCRVCLNDSSRIFDHLADILCGLQMKVEDGVEKEGSH